MLLAPFFQEISNMQPFSLHQVISQVVSREFVQRQYKIRVQWSKRAYTRRQRDVFLGRHYSEDPDVHAMLRQSKRTQTTPVAQPVWDNYLIAHFRRSMRQLNWAGSKQIGKMNGRASPGFDCVAAPFIKYAAVVCPWVNGRGIERVNVLVPCIARLFKLFYDKARIPECWKKAKLTPLYKKVPLLEPNSYRMLAVSGTMYRLYT
eukprot:1137137-Pelagomonas_calceolata.AAC.1